MGTTNCHMRSRLPVLLFKALIRRMIQMTREYRVCQRGTSLASHDDEFGPKWDHCEMNRNRSSDESDNVVDPVVELRIATIKVCKAILPYPDVTRRWRIRRHARSLIRFTPWPEEDASPLELAQLCLVRSISLQRQIHRAVRWHHHEAAAFLARSSLENTLLGLWCLHADRPVDRLRADAGRRMKRAFDYLVDGDPLKQELIDLVVEEIGGQGFVPGINKMAESVSNAVDSDLTTDLYKRVYGPLSAFFSHANGIVLMRYVKPKDGRPRFRPTYPWHRRGPARTADASLAVLALAVAARLEEPQEVKELFATYASRHLSRTLPPLSVMAGRGTRGSIQWRRIPAGIMRLRASARYMHSSEAMSDPWALRERRIRSDITEIMTIYKWERAFKSFPKFVDLLVRMIIGEDPDPEAEPDIGG